jgi:short-subunit dehydrogenase
MMGPASLHDRPCGGTWATLKPLINLRFFPFLYYNKNKLLKKLAGKTVLITGASYGIGEALAYELAKTKVRLILIARTEEKLIVVKNNIEKVGGEAIIFPCDLTDQAAISKLLVQLASEQIDIVVSNAGKSIRRPLFQSLDRFHDFTRTMNLNYYGPVQLLLGLIPGLVERKGQIINISAINVLLIPAPYWAAYQASKTAFDQWFRSAEPELNARGVGTSSIYLPLVRTRMISPTKAYDKMPAMQPEQVAKLICKAINTRRRYFAPWWLFFAKLASLLFRWAWVPVLTKMEKAKFKKQRPNKKP